MLHLMRTVYHLFSCYFKQPHTQIPCRIAPVSTASHRLLRAQAVRVSRTQLQNLCPSTPVFGMNELDSHADTCVLGQNFVIIQYSGRECDVIPYTDQYEPVKGVPIVSGATSWTDQTTGDTWILVIHEAIWMADSMSHSLLNPNQLRAHGIDVEDNPSRGPLYIAYPPEALSIPLQMFGTNISFESRTPTAEELDTCQHIHLTSRLEWAPASAHEHFPTAQVSSLGSLPSDASHLDECNEIYNPDTFSSRLLQSLTTTPRAVQSILTDTTTPYTFSSQDRRVDVTPQTLSDCWMIGLTQAQLTLKHTTQRFTRSALLPLARRYKADRIYHLPRLQGEWYTDTVFGRMKSRDGNICGQIFANANYFAVFYPMDTKAKAGDALRTFCAEYGIPERLVHDGAKEMCGRNTDFQATIRKHGIRARQAEAEMHNQSPAEGVVREVRKRWFRVMFRKKVPKTFWDYGIKWACEIMSRTYLRNHRVNGGVPITKVTGETVDISPYIEFGFYDRVWFRDNAGLGPQMPGRWLGVATNVGAMMCSYILQGNGQVTARSTVWRVTNLELQTTEVQSIFDEFDNAISDISKKDKFPMKGDKPDPDKWADLLETDKDFRDEFYKVYDSPDIAEADAQSPEESPSPGIMDEDFLRMELSLPRDNSGPALARVKKRLKDANGNPIGVANSNPILDTRIFEVEFLDGHTASMTANAIAENLFAQV
jgi:hypothetical protein